MVDSWNHADKKTLKKIKAICFDIDDTVTTNGKLTPSAYQAIWNLKKHGYILIPLTGRPASWCDHIARFWPVDAVVGENGAFTFFMNRGKRERFDTLGQQFLQSSQEHLKNFKKNILKNFKNAQFASDQNYREYDLAIDICEDVPAWSKEEISRLLTFCKEQGAHAKLSSIHVNIWFGDYDKALGLKSWLASDSATTVLSKKLNWDELIFIGDSPNDMPLFKTFNQSVAVANIKKYINELEFKPTWITDKESGDGFIEFTKKICEN